MKNYKQIEKLLEDIGIDAYLENVPCNNFDELSEYLQDNGMLDTEVIYYSNAMEYLGEHDPSLQLSIGLANELGYELKNINSELLASLLQSENLKEEFSKLEDQITELLK